jgi:two-component system nitrogen regulation response regulator GlnG
LGVEPKRIADGAQHVLNHFAFPGNVRQLENICHWLTVMAPSQLIEVKDLPPEVQQGADGAWSGDEHDASASLVKPVAALPQDTARTTTAVTPPLSSSNNEPRSTHAPVAPVVLNMPGADWEQGLEAEAMSLLVAGRTDVWDALVNRVEARLIQTALANTRGRRIEAAQKLGIGRNTITRKIQELGLED